MSNEKLRQYIQKQSWFDPIAIITAAILIGGSLTGLAWISSNNQKTIWGEKVKVIEETMKAEKQKLDEFRPIDEKGQEFKDVCLTFSKVSLGQNFMIRQLIDLGFLVSLLWIGMFMLGVSFSFMRYKRNLKAILDEEEAA